MTFSLFALSCERTEQIESFDLTTTSHLHTNKGLLVFRDISAYEETIKKFSSKESSLSQIITVTSGNFVSMADFYSANKSARVNFDSLPISSAFLAKILNKDGVIQIGKWIIRVNEQKKSVTVLEEKNYSDLVKDVRNSSIYTFSTNDEVLDYLEAGLTTAPTGRTAIFCGGGVGAIDRYDEKLVPILSNTYYPFYLKAVHKYDKFGVYFEAKMLLRANPSGDWAPPTSNPAFNCGGTVNYSYDYETNCRNSWGRQNSCPSCGFGFCSPIISADYEETPLPGHDFTIYQGSWGLQRIKMSATWTWNGVSVHPEDINLD